MIPLVLISAVVLGLAFLVYASYNVSSNVYVNAFCRAKTTRKVVALTFDDGPHGENTEAVLDLLSAKKIPAAFFCIGSKAETQPEVVRRMVRDGHLVGNHSYSHSAKFPVFDVDRMVADIAKCNEVLEKITEEKVLFFRPPFGVTNPLLKKALKSFKIKFKVTVAQEEMGKVIGKQGKVTQSIKSLMRAVGGKEQKKVEVEFVD